ncbi:dihydrofolate reductase [Escherichia coli]|uniref:dihydrofolate reductase n=1 Tax=Escherichia coli TaxID=562 RepID=UPI001BB28C41|nr:dihydrofolate reductase [Escherichia coli]
MKMIAAVGRNYEIGIANELPWRCSTDLKLFKRLTKNATVVMGRKTMESLKRPLPERHNSFDALSWLCTKWILPCWCG